MLKINLCSCPGSYIARHVTDYSNLLFYQVANPNSKVSLCASVHMCFGDHRQMLVGYQNVCDN